jgi:F-type H+-transporting ATPase subunit gamma
MAALKDIQRKIGAVKKTQQITKAMNMVAAARLRGAQEAVERFRPFADKFREVLASLAGGVEPDLHPFFQPRESVRKIGLILITSDRGLCGSFNTNLINTALKFMKAKKEQGIETVLLAAGRQGLNFYKRRNYNLQGEYLDVLTKPDFILAQDISRAASDLFLSGDVDEIHMIYSTFVNVVLQKPTETKLLPFSPEDLLGEEAEAGTGAGEFQVEPSAGEVLIELLPRNVSVQIFAALLETATSVNAAQMTAMENATSNCKEMIEDLTLAFNKARQAAITAELMDIVGGAEALNQ